MDKTLKKTTFKGHHKIDICGSKSESNRLLILKKLYPVLDIENLSTSDDTRVMVKALSETSDEVNVHHAGTAMRFLTAYYSCFTDKTLILTGSERMQNRPISFLVEALQALGANIEYVEKEGYPPLKISPALIGKNKVKLRANVSSQYLSALMLVAPMLKRGIQIELDSEITSLPYLKMTERLMQDLGFSAAFQSKEIKISPKQVIEPQTVKVESDWSSASYFYSLVALNPELSIELSTFKKYSLQGDANLAKLYEPLGVQTEHDKDCIILTNTQNVIESPYKKNLNDNPDLAQTIVVTCLGLGKACELEGLHTLKIKETDRLLALKNELQKLGVNVKITESTLSMLPEANLKPDQNIATYNDHRMAMAFAPLCSKVSLNVLNAEVVSKSYPEFWNDLDKLLI